MQNYSPKTVKIFLVDGDPTGAKKVQLSNWSGFAYIIPRNKLEVIRNREELAKQCLYFLIGGPSTSPEVYVGEAENFRNRIPQHQSKDFWNTCVVFLSKDENLSKAHVRYLEAEFVEECKIANRAKIHNGNSPEGSKLPEEDEHEMHEFIQNIKLLLSTLGYTFHENVTAQDKTYDVYYIKSKGVEAKGMYTSEGIILLEGSQIVKDEAPSIHEYLHVLRSENFANDSCIDKGSYFEVVKRIEFSSLSTAAGFILGRASNGWKEWKNKDGKTIDEIERKVLE